MALDWSQDSWIVETAAIKVKVKNGEARQWPIVKQIILKKYFDDKVQNHNFYFFELNFPVADWKNVSE